MKYAVFGSGINAKYAINNIRRMFAGTDIYLIDNFHYDFQYEAFGEKYPVYHVSKLLEENFDEIMIIISSVKNHGQIAMQLREMGFIEGKHFFGGPKFVYGRWMETGELHPAMHLRVKLMSEMISPDSCSVLDIGCGDMYLKNCLCSNVAYIPCDYICHDNTTIVCDLNKGQYPEVQIDTVFLSGILEHIEDSEIFLDHICMCAKKEIILSYNTVEYRADYEERCRSGMMNHFSVYDIVEMFKMRKMTLQLSKHFQYPSQLLFRFTKENGNKYRR